MPILGILTVLMGMVLGIGGHLKGVEGVSRGGNRTVNEFRALSENEAEEVKRIWRAIADQEIVKWIGKEWLAKTESQKREVIKKACETWRRTGYQKIESIEYFIEDIDKYYRHFKQKNPEENTKAKVGLVLSLSAFFQGMSVKGTLG